MFNFKNKNLLIILLLILVLASCLCFISMQNTVESFNNSKNNSMVELRYTKGKDKYYLLNTTKQYYLTNGRTIDNHFIDFSDHDISTNYFNMNINSVLQSNKPIIYKQIDASNIKLYKNITNSNLKNFNFDISSTDLCSNKLNTINMLFKVDTSTNKVYDICNNIFTNLSIEIDNKFIILNGEITDLNSSIVSDSDDTKSDSDDTKSDSDDTKSDRDDIIASVLDSFNTIDNSETYYSGSTPVFGTSGELAAYMLGGGLINPALLTGYKSPYFNNFESTMNYPSNPVVNPINSMNPLQYSQAMFGPNVTPMMAKNTYSNLEIDEKSKNKSSNSDLLTKLSATPGSLFVENTNNTNNTNNTSNTNNTNNTNNTSNTSNQTPCPPCGRCPESNFECKKIPKYESANENAFLPRPVLTDFSTFGS